MAEPSQSRVDLSRIHPLKRVALIALRFMIGASLAASIALQFVWVQVFLNTEIGALIVDADHIGLVVESQACRIFRGNEITYGHGGYDTDRTDPRYAFDESYFHPGTYDAIRVAPGLTLHRISEYWTLEIHHSWLVSITAALYLITRWRIRRTARLQSLPT